MDITLFAAVAQIAPFFRDKGFAVMEFVNKFSEFEEARREELLDVLGDLDMVTSRYVKADWPKAAYYVHSWT